MVWGEPTKGANFGPLGNPRRAARTYARMLDAAYALEQRIGFDARPEG